MKYFVLVIILTVVSSVLLSGQNLLQNPGFESWTGDSCHYWDNETGSFDLHPESGTVHSGTYSAKLVLKSTSTQRLTQYVTPVNPGNAYEGSFWGFDNDPYCRIRLYIRFFDGSGSFISGSSFWSEYTSDSTEWQYLTAGPSNAPDSAVTAHFEIRMYDVSGFSDSATSYADDAEFLDLGTGTPPETLTIYEIQGQSSSSPYEDSTVVTHGIVTGVFGSGFFIEEQPGGSWHGIYVYGNTSPVRGDSVRITGTITEYYGMTEFDSPSVQILSSGVSLPGPEVLPTGSVSTEEYESVLTRVVNADCTNDSLGYGEWELDDGSGPVIIDDMGVSYVPDTALNYTVTGPVMFDFGDFKIEPRDSNDIIALGIEEVKETDPGFHFSVYPTVSTHSISINLVSHRKRKTEVVVYNISGRKIETLLEENLDKGDHILTWTGENVPTGVYFITARSGDISETVKVSIIR
jgi:hypothetical protein